MRQLFGYFSVIVSLLLLAAAQAAARQGHNELQPFPIQPAIEAGQAADFALMDMDGRERRLAEFKGKVLLVHFWASWCEPCRTEFPALSRLAADLGSRGFNVIAIATDSRERVGSFLKENRASFPVLIDQYGSVMRKYKVSLIPVSVVVGRDGRVVGTLLGPRDYGSVEAREYFEKILK